MVRLNLDSLEQLRQASAEGLSRHVEVLVGADADRRPERHVDATSASQIRAGLLPCLVRATHAVEPLAAPQSYGDDGDAGLAGQTGRSAHEGTYGVGVGDPGLGEPAHGLALVQ